MSTIEYKISSEQKAELIKKFPPKYSKAFGDHITLKMGGIDAETPEAPDKIQIVGIVDDGNGLEAMIIKVNGELKRPDGKIFHMTWSLNPEGIASEKLDIMAKPGKEKQKPYKPIHSNGLVSRMIDENGRLLDSPDNHWKITMFDKPIDIKVTPTVQYDAVELQKLSLGRSV